MFADAFFAVFHESSVRSWIKEAFEPTTEQKMIEVPVVKKRGAVDIFKFVAAGAALALASGVVAASEQAQINPSVAVEFQSQQASVFGVASSETVVAARSGPLATSFQIPLPLATNLSLESAVSVETRDALGIDGLARLNEFASLPPGWDGGIGNSLNFESLARFNDFFYTSRLKPPHLGVFMSQDGNLIVNWISASGFVIELEFFPDSIAVFTEDDGETLLVDRLSGRFFRNLINKTIA